MRERRTSDDLADAFIAEGYDTLFGLFGDGNLTFMAAMTERSGIRVVHARHEAAAVFMAAGYCRATGRAALASVTAGPGLAHTLTPLTSSCRARLPLVLYAGDTPQGSGYVGGLQGFDHKAFADLAGASYIRADGGRAVAECVAEATRLAVREQRPVVFSVPEDYMEELSANADVGDRQLGRGETAREPAVAHTRHTTADAQTIERITTALASAERPLLVAGSGAVAAEALPQIRALGRRYGAALATTFRAKGCFDDDPANVGIIGPLAHASHQRVQEQADLVVGFGANLHGFGAFVDTLFTCNVLCLGAERYGALEGPHPGDCEIMAPLASVLDALAETTVNAPTRSFVPAASKRDAIDSDFAELPECREADVLDPRRLMLELDDLLADDCVVVVGGGHFWSSPLLYLSKRQRDFVFPIEFGSIGMGLPTGIGVAAARLARDVIVIEGDGGVIASVQEIETAARHGLRLTVLVMNDAALGAEYHKLVARGLAPQESAYPPIEFAALARAFGARGHVARSIAEARDAYESARGVDAVNVIDARISKDVTSRWYRRLYLKTV